MGEAPVCGLHFAGLAVVGVSTPVLLGNGKIVAEGGVRHHPEGIQIAEVELPAHLVFRPDGTGEYVSRYWINQDAQQNITEQWYERLDERQVFPYTYRLEGNALTITYSDLPNSFSVNLRLYEDGSLSMVDVFGYAAKYVSVQIAPTLEALCDAMQVDYTLPPPPM